MKVFITGISGLVGGYLARLTAERGYQGVGTMGSFQGVFDFGIRVLRFGLEEAEAVEAAVESFNPDVIINAAAISEPAKCDAQPQLSHRLNVLLPEQLARLAQIRGSRFIHLSSEQVFDGQNAPYSASDPVCPINLYGRQKAESEQRIHTVTEGAGVVLRIPLLMGNSPAGTRSLHERLLADWSAGREPRLFVDEYRQTCTAKNLAEVILDICDLPETRGVYHWAGAQLLSRYEQAARIRDHFKLTSHEAPIASICRADFPTVAAQRPANLGLVAAPLSRWLQRPLESFDDQLAQLQLPMPLQEWYRQLRRPR